MKTLKVRIDMKQKNIFYGFKNINRRTIMRQRQILVSILMVLIFFNFIFITGCKNGKTEEKVIKIGAILPLTGSLAFFGGPEKDILHMALEELNNSGGINGKKVELIMEDSKSTAKDGISAAQKILLQKPIAVITSMTIISNATQPIFKENKILQIALSVHPKIAEQSAYTIRPYYGFDDEIKVVSKYFQKKGLKNIGALWVMVPESESAINNILIPELNKFGGKLISSEPFNFGSLDVKEELLKIKKENPDSIFTIDFGNMMGIILKEAQNLDIRDKIVGGIAFFYAPPIEKDLLENVPFAGPTFVIENSEEYQEFSEKFKAKFGKETSYDVCYTYDAFNFLIETIRKSQAGNIDLLEAVKSIKTFTGISGRMEIQENGNVSVSIRMGIYKDGKMVPLDL
jgi:branched-chain amino acid transport system substrate-binding protein